MDISIVILVKEPPWLFYDTIKCIYNQNTEFDYETIIVNSGSRGDGNRVLNKIASDFSVKIHDIESKDFNFGLTRDYGFNLSKGEYIVTISQDVIPINELWLEYLISPFKLDEDIVAVQGATNVPEGDVFYWERNGLFWFTSEVDHWHKIYRFGLSFVNCAIRRQFWEKNPIGYAIFSEDKKYQKKIIDNRKKCYVERRAVCTHGHQYDLKSLIYRLIGEGRGWRYADMNYTTKELIYDYINKKHLVKKAVIEYKNGEIKNISELLFPIIRPILIYLGNKSSKYDKYYLMESRRK